MPLTRYQIRSEYGLADPELYRAADRDDPEALLEGVAMAGLVGVLRQLGDLAEFAAEIFHDLHEEVMATAARGHGLMMRVQQLEAEVPPIEKAFLSRTSHSLFLNNAGVGWHPNLQMDQNLITQGDLPRFVMDCYEECRGPPQLFLLDKFDIAGAGTCLKRYSDPSFFKAELASSEKRKADIQREKKARKVKKKGSRWWNEAPEVFPTSHATLHQFLLVERSQAENNAPTHRVKLKKRQYNGTSFDSTTGKSYMERFLETHSPEHKIAYESSLGPPHLHMKSSNNSDLGIEIHETSMKSPANNLLQRERGLESSPNRQEAMLELSVFDVHEDVIKGGILEKLPEPIPDDIKGGVLEKLPEPIPDVDVEKIPSSFYKMDEQKESMVDVERKSEASADNYQSDDITSEVEYYTDALTTMELEMETDTENRPKNMWGIFNTEMQGMDSDRNKKQQELQAQFSDSHSIENSCDDGTNLFKKVRPNFSYSETLSNLAENSPPDADTVPKLYTSTETVPAEILDISSKKLTSNGDALVTDSSEYVAPNSSCIEVSEIPSYRSEFVEVSSNSCVTDSTSTLSHLNPGTNLSDFQLQGPESVELSSGYMKFGVEGSSLITEEDCKKLCGDLPCTTTVSDFASQMKDDFLSIGSAKSQPVEEMDGQNSEQSCALLHVSNVSDLVLEKKCSNNNLEVVPPTECAEDGSTGNFMNGKLDSSYPVSLPTEEHLSGLAGQDLETGSGTMQLECLPGSTSTHDLDNVKPDKIVVGTDTSMQSTGENSEYLTSVLDISKSGDFAELDFTDVTDELLPPDLDLGVSKECSGVKTLNNNLEILSYTSASGIKDDSTLNVVQLNSCGSAGKVAVSPEFPSMFVVSDSLKPASVTDLHSQVDNSGTETVYAEAKADDDTVTCPKLIVSPSWNHIKLQEECPAGSRDSGDLVTEVHSQLDDSITGTVHAEAGGDDTAVCPNLIGSSFRNHIKLQEEFPSVNEDLGDSTTKVHSQLDNLVTGTVHAEVDDADSADCPNLIGSPSGNHIKLQEECPTNGELDQSKLEITEGHSWNCIIGSDAQKEANQLAVAHTDLNFELCNLESFDPSSSKLLNNVHDSLLVDHTQNHLCLNDVTRAPISSKESNLEELNSALQSYLSESAENAMFSATHSLQELGVPSEQASDFADHLIMESLHEDGENPVLSNLQYDHTESPNHRDQDGCSIASSKSSWVDPPVKQTSVPELSQVPISHNFESFDPTIESVNSIFPSLGMFPGTTHEQPSEPLPNKPVSNFPLPDPNTVQANLEMPPLPPLPPIQWRIGKLQHGSLTQEREMLQPSLNPFSPSLPASADEKSQQGFPTLEGEIAKPLNPFLLHSVIEDKKPQHGSETIGLEMAQPGLSSFSSNSQQGSPTLEGNMTQPLNTFMRLPVMVDEKSQLGSLTSGEEVVLHGLNPFVPLPTIEDVRHTSLSLQGELVEFQNPLLPKPSIEDGLPQHTSLTLEGGIVQPLNSFAPPTIKDEKPPHGSLTSEEETAWPSNTSVLSPSVEVEMPNGHLPTKQPRPRDPLIEAVASHDKSMLRKVTERVQSLTGPKVDKRDSLLEQIRTKSFNLKPAVTKRPSIQGPETNLKVAAILEKANAIRQALAGSDEDDDGDSWSDS